MRNRVAPILQRMTVDASPFLQDTCIRARDEIVSRTLRDQKDTHGMPFKPLASSTVERKRAEGRVYSRILYDHGGMTDLAQFRITKGKTRASLIHRAPRSARMVKTGKITAKGRARRTRYDYGRAHQYSKRAKLPRREWWLAAGSIKANAFKALTMKRLKAWAWKGTIEGRPATATGF